METEKIGKRAAASVHDKTCISKEGGILALENELLSS